jgi:hypothetical protein
LRHPTEFRCFAISRVQRGFTSSMSTDAPRKGREIRKRFFGKSGRPNIHRLPTVAGIHPPNDASDIRPATSMRRYPARITHPTSSRSGLNASIRTAKTRRANPHVKPACNGPMERHGLDRRCLAWERRGERCRMYKCTEIPGATFGLKIARHHLALSGRRPLLHRPD